MALRIVERWAKIELAERLGLQAKPLFAAQAWADILSKGIYQGHKHVSQPDRFCIRIEEVLSLHPLDDELEQ